MIVVRRSRFLRIDPEVMAGAAEHLEGTALILLAGIFNPVSVTTCC